MEERIEEVKAELRALRKLSHSVEAGMRARELHEKRLTYLRRRGDPSDADEIRRIERIIASLLIDEHIARLSALEEKYMPLINSLPECDRTIILEGYVNGKAYWRIGRDIGYSEVGVKKRVDAAMRKMAESLSKT